VSTQTFPQSRENWGVIWLIIGGIGLIGLLYLSFRTDPVPAVTSIDTPQVFSTLFFFLFLITSLINKVMAMMRKMNAWLQIAAFTSPIIYSLFDVLSHTSDVYASNINVSAAGGSQALWGIVFLAWMIGWWLFDIRDFLKYGLKSLRK